MLEVRRASVVDAETIASCTREAYNIERIKYDVKNPSNGFPSTEQVENTMEKHTYYKIVLDGLIIGGVFLVKEDEKTVSIQDFCISPAYQNRGYGKSVLRELERMHCDMEKLMLTTPLYSVGNQHLYEGQGYKKVKIDDFGGVLSVYYEKIFCREK